MLLFVDKYDIWTYTYVPLYVYLVANPECLIFYTKYV